MIKLFYKSYDYKMSLGAMRDYREATGNCLWHDLLAVMEAFESSGFSLPAGAGNMYALTHRMVAISKVVSFDSAVHLFKSLIDAGGESVSIDEIDDAMLRSGMMPSDRPDDCGEPWTMALLLVARKINDNMIDEVKKKPQALISQAEQEASINLGLITSRGGAS